jgi:hypothetical protein
MKVDVLNLHHYAYLPQGIYIGRKKGAFHYGNPFSHLANTRAAFEVATREEGVENYNAWLDGVRYANFDPERRIWILQQIEAIAMAGEDVTLLCFCSPLACHGDVLARRICQLAEKLARR